MSAAATESVRASDTETNEYVASLPMILAELTVASVERVSPSFVRIELAGPELAEFGTPGPVLDQRFKLIFPNAAGRLPSFADADASWWTSWMEIPEDERGSMRTYTVRDVVGTGSDTRLVVDIVVHDIDGHSEGNVDGHADGDPLEGAGNRWALQAEVGQRLVAICPRAGHEFGGIEWAPGAARRLLLVGDETAWPAIRGILRDLPADAYGAAFVELPVSADVPTVAHTPEGVRLTFLPRDGRARGVDLHRAVLDCLAAEAAPLTSGPAEVTEDEIDPSLWETPVYSSSGESVPEATEVPDAGTPYAGLYAWIAGESKVVTGLRRVLVKDLGFDRGQVAFMGYWREGVSMRS